MKIVNVNIHSDNSVIPLAHIYIESEGVSFEDKKNILELLKSKLEDLRYNTCYYEYFEIENSNEILCSNVSKDIVLSLVEDLNNLKLTYKDYILLIYAD